MPIPFFSAERRSGLPVYRAISAFAESIAALCAAAASSAFSALPTAFAPGSFEAPMRLSRWRSVSVSRLTTVESLAASLRRGAHAPASNAIRATHILMRTQVLRVVDCADRCPVRIASPTGTRRLATGASRG